MYDKKYLVDLLVPQRVGGEDSTGPYDACTLTESVEAVKLRLRLFLGLENASGKGDYMMRYVGGFSEESPMLFTYVGLKLARIRSTGGVQLMAYSRPPILLPIRSNISVRRRYAGGDTRHACLLRN